MSDDTWIYFLYWLSHNKYSIKELIACLHLKCWHKETKSGDDYLQIKKQA